MKLVSQNDAKQGFIFTVDLHWYIAFFVKAKILCRFFSVSENKYWCRSFLKVKW